MPRRPPSRSPELSKVLRAQTPSAEPNIFATSGCLPADSRRTRRWQRSIRCCQLSPRLLPTGHIQVEAISGAAGLRRAEMHLLPHGGTARSASEKHSGSGSSVKGRVSALFISDQNKTPKSGVLNYSVCKTTQESHFGDGEMTLSILPTAMTQSC